MLLSNQASLLYALTSTVCILADRARAFAVFPPSPPVTLASLVPRSMPPSRDYRHCRF